MIPRLYHEEPLSEGREILLDRPQTHYLARVLRRHSGDPVVVFNARDGEFEGRFEPRAHGVAALFLTQQKRPAGQSRPGPNLAFAPLQRASMEWLIEKATELGVGRFLPTFTRFSGPHRLHLERLEKIAREAAEQTERMDIPAFDHGRPLAERLTQAGATGRVLLCAEAGPTRPIADVLLEEGPTAAQDSTLLIGPEGGFAAEELAHLAALPFVTSVGLGPRILRAETAALAALAVFQAIAGDGREKAPRPMVSVWNR